MPTPELPVDLIADTIARAEDVMADLNSLLGNLDGALDGENLELSTPGQMWVADAAGKSRPVTLSGDASVDYQGVVSWQPEFHFAQQSVAHDLIAHGGTYADVSDLKFTAAKTGLFFVISSINFFLAGSASSADPEIVCRARLHLSFDVAPGEADSVGFNYVESPTYFFKQWGSSGALVTQINLVAGQTAVVQAILESTLGVTVAQITTASTLAALKVSP